MSAQALAQQVAQKTASACARWSGCWCDDAGAAVIYAALESQYVLDIPQLHCDALAGHGPTQLQSQTTKPYCCCWRCYNRC